MPIDVPGRRRRRAHRRGCSPTRRPTAIFAANNLLAEQAWHALRRRGLEHPARRLARRLRRRAVDGAWCEPAITAVAQPAFEMGRRAALLLLRRLDDPACEPHGRGARADARCSRGSDGSSPAREVSQGVIRRTNPVERLTASTRVVVTLPQTWTPSRYSIDFGGGHMEGQRKRVSQCCSSCAAPSLRPSPVSAIAHVRTSRAQARSTSTATAPATTSRRTARRTRRAAPRARRSTGPPATSTTRSS